MSLNNKWYNNYEEYKKYLQENDNHRPKRGSTISKSGCDLGEWEHNQRKAYKLNTLDKKRVDLLNNIGFQWKLIEKRHPKIKENRNENHDYKIEKKKRRTKQFMINHLKEEFDNLSKEIDKIKKEQNEKDKVIDVLNNKNFIRYPLDYQKYKKDQDIFHMKKVYLHDVVKGMITIFPEQKESVDRILQHFTYLIDFEKNRKKEIDDEEQADKEAYEEMQKYGIEYDDNDDDNEPSSL